MNKHEQVFTELLRDIQNGRYRAGQKLPSEAALGTRFRTSRITVGRALRELKQRDLITGVAGSGNFVKATVAMGEALRFGLLIPNLGETEIFEPICQGMASASEAGVFALVWGQSPEEADLETQALALCEQYIAQRVAGVFFAPLERTAHAADVNLRISEALTKAGIPVVLLDRCVLPFPQRSRHDLVGIDNRRAGYIAHLLSLGCREIGFLALEGGAPTVEGRIAGYRETLIRHGVGIESRRVVRLERISVSLITAAMKESECDAFVCANDRIAGEFLQVLHQLGKRVPEDIRVVGMDDVEYARLLSVPLTTVRQPCREIGKAAIAAMFSRRERPGMIARDILLNCELVVRESSGGV